MNLFIKALSSLSSRRILVLGDFLLDRYIEGEVLRISPEAPVPILRIKSEKSVPGGAGNVALGLAALGMHVIPIGRIGHDSFGRELSELFLRPMIEHGEFFKEDGFPTPVKTRLLASSQQMLRTDKEEIIPLSAKLQKKIEARLLSLFDMVDLVVISDYGKGFLTKELLAFVIHEAKSREIEVLVDPKGSDFTRYYGATLIKPNLKEAYIAANASKEKELSFIASELLDKTAARYLMVTRSEAGISLFSRHEQLHFPAVAKSIVDVTGAGDTVLCTLAACMANQIPLEVAIPLANFAASIAIETMGCSIITQEMLLKRVKESSPKKEKLFPLKERLPIVTLLLREESDLSSLLYERLLHLKKEHPHHLIILLIEGYRPFLYKMASELSVIDGVLALEEADLLLGSSPSHPLSRAFELSLKGSALIPVMQ